MDDQQPQQPKLSPAAEMLRALFGKPTEIRAELPDGLVSIHYLREPTKTEYLAHLAKTSAVRVRDGRVQPAADSLVAGVELYDQICQRVAIENGAELEDVEGFREIFPSELKALIITVWQGRHKISMIQSRRVAPAGTGEQ